MIEQVNEKGNATEEAGEHETLIILLMYVGRKDEEEGSGKGIL